MKPDIPKNYVGIPVKLPMELFEHGRLGDFMRMLHNMIYAKMCTLRYDGKPIASVQVFYLDTDGATIYVKESDIHEYYTKYPNAHASPIGILDTESGSYLRFTGFNLLIR